MRFNLLADRWITIIRDTGETDQVSMLYALTNAHKIRDIYETLPTFAYSVRRLLSLIVQDIFMPLDEEDFRDLIEAGKFDLMQLLAFQDEFDAEFELVGQEAFMQDNSIPADQPGPAYTPKPAAYLTPDVPVAVNHTHFRHVSDATTVICPSCAAHGLVSLPQFVTIGGQGFWQGINPGPPIYVEPVGHNLFETLVFSMVLPENQTKTDTWGPPWRRTGAHQPKTVDKVDNAWGGTFLPRRVRLYPVEHKGPCTRCGMPMEFGVKDIIYMSGPKWIGEAGTWVDPFCFYRKGRPVGAYGEYNDWTERMAKIFAGDPDKKGVPTAVKPIIVRQTQALGINVSWRLIFARTDQAKYFETGEVVVSPSGG